MCLDKLAGFARRQLQKTIKCPVCQTSFQIPEGDTFNNLPTSFHLNRLVDVFALMAVHRHRNAAVVTRTTAQLFRVPERSLSTACFDTHQRLKATIGHSNVFIGKLQAQDVEELINRPGMHVFTAISRKSTPGVLL